jgi:hypothetical protein
MRYPDPELFKEVTNTNHFQGRRERQKQIIAKLLDVGGIRFKSTPIIQYIRFISKT